MRLLNTASCELFQGDCAAPALHGNGSSWQLMARSDPELQSVVAAWDQLPDPARSAITMLIRVNVTTQAHLSMVAERRDKFRQALALRLARDSRHVIQGCLREEEWEDADQEFFDVIIPHL